MNDNSPNTSRIVFVSALFGILAAVVALWALDFRFIGAILIGLIVSAIVWIILWMGWKTPQGNAVDTSTQISAPAVDTQPITTSVPDVAAKPATTTSAASTTPAAVASAPVTAAVVAKPATAKAAAKPAVAKAAAKPAAAKAAAKPAAAKAAAKPAAAKAAAKPAAAKATAKPAAKAKNVVADKPAVLATARDGGPDDLKMIKGVGPVLEKALHTTGVFHFDQVAAWTNRDARWFDENVKGANGRVLRDEWIKQARILAKGGTTAFSNKVKKGGVY